MAEEGTQKTMLQTYKSRLKASRDACEGNWARAIDNYKHYLGRLDVGGLGEEEYPFGSQMTVPISYEIVETVLPRFIGRDPEFTSVAIEPEDVPFESSVKTILDMQYNNPKLAILGEPIYLKLFKGVKEGLITGNFVLRAYWRRESRKRVSYLANLERTGHKDEADVKKVLDMAKEMGAQDEFKWSKKVVDMPFLDDFDLRHVPFFHFFPDTAFDMPGRMRYKIEREYMTFEELADEAMIFGYDKVVMNEVHAVVARGAQGHSSDIPKDFLQEYNELFTTSVNPKVFSTDDDKIPLLIVDKMWMGDRLAVFVNEKYNLTGDTGIRNPYDLLADPFIYGQDVIMPHSYFAWGEIDAIRKLEDGVIDTVNMRFDNLLQSMLNYWLYNPKFISSGDEFVPVPNSVTATTDIDRAVRVISGKDVTASAYKEVDELMNMVKSATGANDYVKGSEGETLAGRTYGGLRLVQEMANARFIVKSRMFEKLTLQSLGYFMLEMSRQFVNKDRVRRIAGEMGEVEEKTAKAEDLKQIKGFMDIKVVPNSSMVIDQQAEAMKMDRVADRFSSGKGPFKSIPESVNEKFLYKYLTAYGVHDAVYWIRAIREARLEREKKGEVTEEQGSEVPPEAQALGGAVMPTLQSDGVTNQVDPIQQIMESEPSTIPLA